MSKQTVVISAVAAACLIVGFGIGYGSGSKNNGNPLAINTSQRGNQADTFDAGWNAAKQKLKESGILPMVSQALSLNGELKEVKGEKLILSVSLLNPLDDESLKERTVTLADGAKIILREFKTQDELKSDEAIRNKKVTELQAKMNSEKDQEKKGALQMEIMQAQMPADMMKETEIKLADIKPGYQISVEAKEDISGKKEFIAEKISVQANNPAAIIPGGSAMTPAPAPTSNSAELPPANLPN